MAGGGGWWPLIPPDCGEEGSGLSEGSRSPQGSLMELGLHSRPSIFISASCLSGMVSRELIRMVSLKSSKSAYCRGGRLFPKF